MKLVIRNMTEGDLDVAVEIGGSAFGRPEGTTDSIKVAWDSQPDGCFLAVAEGEPVGTALIVDYGSYCYIGAMCVRPEHQRRGIGDALLDRLMEWRGEAGNPPALLDATEVGARLYRRYGFEGIGLAHAYRCHSVPGGDATVVRPGIRPLRPEDLGALLEFDLPIFGGDRGRVLRALIERFPHRGFVSTDGRGGVDGFVVSQGGRIGPWVAGSVEVARVLLERALSVPFSRAPKVCVPGETAAALDLVERCGFERSDTATHMALGASEPLAHRTSIYGQTSFALG